MYIRAGDNKGIRQLTHKGKLKKSHLLTKYQCVKKTTSDFINNNFLFYYFATIIDRKCGVALSTGPRTIYLMSPQRSTESILVSSPSSSLPSTTYVLRSGRMTAFAIYKNSATHLGTIGFLQLHHYFGC